MTTLQKSTAIKSRLPSVHLFTREEYRQMADTGLFDDSRVELLEGKVIDISPMGTRHSVGTVLAPPAAIILVRDMLPST